MGTPPTPVDPSGGSFRRRLVFPYPYFGSYLVGSEDYTYSDDSAGAASAAERETEGDIYPVFDTVTVVVQEAQVPRSQGAGGDSLLVEQVSVARGSPKLVRLSRRDTGLSVAQVAFFLADSARRLLSAQTVRSPPFTALLQPPRGTAFAGMTVVLPDGRLVTRFVPFTPEPERAP